MTEVAAVYQVKDSNVSLETNDRIALYTSGVYQEIVRTDSAPAFIRSGYWYSLLTPGLLDNIIICCIYSGCSLLS